MTVWDEVKLALLDLQGTGALTVYPDPGGTDARQPPIDITLASWATDAAEDLHRRFGADVKLVVGSVPYPMTRRRETTTRARPAIDPADPSEFRFELEGKAQVRSGRHITTGLRVHNLTAAAITVRTTGSVPAPVVNPATGDHVGGYSGYGPAPLVQFAVPAGGSVVLPLLIGTASSRPELGYAVPAGEWAVSADLKLEDGRVLRTPPMAITITG